MKITGKKGNRRLETSGYSVKLNEKSYKAGFKAGRRLTDPACVFVHNGCPDSFAAGYSDALEFLGRVLFMDRVLARASISKQKRNINVICTST